MRPRCSLFRGVDARERGAGDQVHAFEVAEVFAERGQLAGTRDTGEAATGEVRQVLGHIEAGDLARCVGHAVGLREPGDELRNVGAIGAGRLRAELAADQAAQECGGRGLQGLLIRVVFHSHYLSLLPTLARHPECRKQRDRK